MAGTAAALVCGALSGCNGSSTAPATTTTLYVVAADGNFRSIAAALKAAPPGEVIEVRGGPYAERIVIDKPGIKLRGTGAILDGAGVEGGRGIGIHVSNVSDVEVSGFTVRNFERGIVVQNSTNTAVLRNEVHSSNSKTASTAPPLVAGVDLFEGVVLLGSAGTQVLENVLRNNGHDGLMIAGGSRNNVIRANRIMDNGAQTVPGQFG
ncbi:MAG: right-handed parallel beta-helix repeat-containing protein [Vicinamibacterales bacterium]